MSEVPGVAAEATNDEATSEIVTDETVSAPDTEATPSLEDDMRAVWDKHNPPRDPDTGQFTAREETQQQETTESVEQSTEEQSDQSPREESEAQVEKPAIDLPLNWSSEMKSRLASLGPEHADIVRYAAQRDKEANDALSRAGTQIKALEPLSTVAETYRDSFQRNGVTPQDGITAVLEWERKMANDPAGTVRELVSLYGIDLKELANAKPAQAQPNGGESQTGSAQDPKIAALEAKLRQVESYLTEQQRTALESDRNALLSQIDDFAKDKTHFEAVEPVMTGLISGIRAQNQSLSTQEVLAKAYEQATWAVPEVRQAILSEQRQADDKKRSEEARKKAVDAKKAAGVNVRSTPGQGANPKSMDDDLREVARKHYGNF